ncbi:MAG: methylated-DNA--[protein]-cysteine S-methyltransferase [Actinobacteria bacterium]|uniref:methylated-DNA--[protein]-cysteine S-methyltransferase n=1 Tax=freshwater metagenome TaxID=449393 RepID=A0A6J7SQL4_9ZZZZ|nr:methylated-DNA--[protein]-cysteine S-methyltransferase [Actinomycetota bacterium]
MQVETFEVFDRPFTVTVVDGFVVHATFDRVPGEHVGIPTDISSAIARYLAGDVNCLTDIPVSQLGSPFQLRVWECMRDIPAGEVASYGELAIDVQSPGAARAVGTACGRNQVALFVPCHRIVASNGIGGYQFGLKLKSDLLEFEAKSR